MKSGGLLPRKSVVALSARLRRAGKTVVFTNGVFDILHRGHVEYLTKARSFGDLLIVGLNTDASVRRLKGKGRPLQPQKDRATVLAALKAVDYVVLFDEDTPARLIEEIHPNVLAKGADYQLPDIVGADLVRSYGGKVKRIRLTPGRSTSSIVRKMRGRS
jgi:rfaE bifunctional protein nucleotidyltransferase chain/domain